MKKRPLMMRKGTRYLCPSYRFYHTVDRRIHHTREHRNLGLERCPVCCSKGIKVVRQNRLPASISCISQRLHLLRRDILTFHHTASRPSRFHRNHHQMVFQETEGHLILRTLYLLRPEVIVIIMTHQTGKTPSSSQKKTAPSNQHEECAGVRHIRCPFPYRSYVSHQAHLQSDTHIQVTIL